MKICFFAQAKKFSGCDEIELAVPKPLKAHELWQELDRQFPGIASMQKTTRLARNHEFAAENYTFGNDDEVALVPPVTGG